jgi:hypothetical protein
LAIVNPPEELGELVVDEFVGDAVAAGELVGLVEVLETYGVALGVVPP